jgi:hypothetical protein
MHILGRVFYDVNDFAGGVGCVKSQCTGGKVGAKVGNRASDRASSEVSRAVRSPKLGPQVGNCSSLIHSRAET